MTLRAAIAAEMQRQNVTIAALARRVGYTRAHLSRYIHGKSDISSGLADKIMGELGLTITTRSDDR